MTEMSEERAREERSAAYWKNLYKEALDENVALRLKIRSSRLVRWLVNRRVRTLHIKLKGEEARVLQLKNYAASPQIGYQYLERHLNALVRQEKLKAELEYIRNRWGKE